MTNININIYYFLMMFIFSMFMFVFYYSQLLMTLISLEFIMLSTLMLLNNMLLLNNSMILILYFMVFVVCESVLGLTILIILIRTYGNDSMNLLNLMW
uniref:NADH-ubiquinone oxidoreductase chain 4L n=1 Tax=Philotrypesis tridentata TaxID=358065 RepID=A0A8A3BZX8_9HYME|nr:NADH dehydrogenase subunit 4L [Philotrypesis tridentata]